MKADFETKRNASKLGARAFLNEMEKMRIEPEDTIDVIAMVAAAMCGTLPNPKEATASFLTVFASSMQAL